MPEYIENSHRPDLENSRGSLHQFLQWFPDNRQKNQGKLLRFYRCFAYRHFVEIHRCKVGAMLLCRNGIGSSGSIEFQLNRDGD